METILFNQKEKRVKTASIKPVNDLTAVVVSSQLLAADKRQILLQQISELSALDPKRVKNLCLSLVNQLTDHCQNLPETSNSYYALPGGILDYALNRTEVALQLFRQYIVQDEGIELSEIQKLWLYAMLSASLLKDIGKLQIDYRVSVFDPHGQHLKLWNPLHESLIAAGGYYQFEFLADSEDKIPLRRRINLLIARFLMPNEGFAWIASDPDVLNVWLALLSDDWQSAGTLGAILIRADAMAIQRYFKDFMIHHVSRRGVRSARIGTFVDSSPEAIIAKEQMVGVEFIKWMTASLDAGQLMINKAPLLMVPGGLLICADAFKLFVRAHPEYKNWLTVQKGFESLKLHRLNSNGEALSRFEQANNQQMHEGVLFENYAIALPQTVKMHNLYTGKQASVSAIETILLAESSHLFSQQRPTKPPNAPRHLNAIGEWVTLAIASALKPGVIKGG